jgi:hypothetical protein
MPYPDNVQNTNRKNDEDLTIAMGIGAIGGSVLAKSEYNRHE